ncbi:MAG TPA: superoxide dismutase [Cu-Zn] SodC [Caulobacteraceae bacterium]|nr:superoxide dismutase [Cu-Zn] SodC [Caulobacteraceae bacterium]
MLRTALIATAALAALAGGSTAAANVLHARMQLATPDGPGADVGTVTISDSYEGARISVNLHGLPPGQHGFHVHTNPSCAPGMVNGAMADAGAAGGHFDPGHNMSHEGPFGFGHLGDLPYLTVSADGGDHETLLAPQIHDVLGLKNRSLIIHAGGDNYSDSPKPLGGGGARIACGVLA